jgi:hypothetical protein
VISIFLALALVAGAFATLRTTSLGARAAAVPAAQIAAKSRQLDRYEAALRREARKRPPTLPPLPAAVRPGTQPTSAAQPQRVIYRRPPAIVRVIHHQHEHESEGLDD